MWLLVSSRRLLLAPLVCLTLLVLLYLYESLPAAPETRGNQHEEDTFKKQDRQTTTPARQHREWLVLSANQAGGQLDDSAVENSSAKVHQLVADDADEQPDFSALISGSGRGRGKDSSSSRRVRRAQQQQQQPQQQNRRIRRLAHLDSEYLHFVSFH